MVEPSGNTPGSESSAAPKSARRLSVFDATMIVMGGIIGSGIFINPSVVARQVDAPFLILGVRQHSADIRMSKEITVNLDYRQMGLGGDDSWGAFPQPQYRMRPQPYRYEFRLEPVRPTRK